MWYLGHSLGAQACASAGVQYKLLTGELIDRITGLDPAGTYSSLSRRLLRQTEKVLHFQIKWRKMLHFAPQPHATTAKVNR